MESWTFRFHLWELALALAYLVIINDSSISQSYIIKKYHSWPGPDQKQYSWIPFVFPVIKNKTWERGYKSLGVGRIVYGYYIRHLDISFQIKLWMGIFMLKISIFNLDRQSQSIFLKSFCWFYRKTWRLTETVVSSK